MTTSSVYNVQQIPTSEILLYIATTFLRNHYTIQGGVQTAQDQLVCHIEEKNIHTGSAVQELIRTTSFDGSEKTIDLTVMETDTQKTRNFKGFHHIIFATPADLSASLLESYRESLSSIGNEMNDTNIGEQVDEIQGMQDELSRVLYESSTVINHTDDSLLPKNRNDWRDLNLVSPTIHGADSKPTKLGAHTANHTMATHVCHQLDQDRFIFQTTNPIVMPHPSSVISLSTFSRALTQSKSRQHRLFSWTKQGILGRWKMQLGPLQAHQNDELLPKLWFCGSYSQGIPLLEGCVTSSSLVVHHIIQQDNC